MFKSLYLVDIRESYLYLWKYLYFSWSRFGIVIIYFIFLAAFSFFFIENFVILCFVWGFRKGGRSSGSIVSLFFVSFWKID